MFIFKDASIVQPPKDYLGKSVGRGSSEGGPGLMWRMILAFD